MRPNPTQHHDSDSGRIIYLGDVRRRRSSKGRQAPDRHYLLVLALAAIAAWGVWLVVLFTLPPARLLTYLAFFVPLSVAVGCTGTLVAYGLEWRLGYFPSLGTCLRRGFLAAVAVVLNLAFLAAHRWILPIGAVSIAAAVFTDLAAALRNR
jgi:hypothetical protein